MIWQLHKNVCLYSTTTKDQSAIKDQKKKNSEPYLSYLGDPDLWRLWDRLSSSLSIYTV